MLVVGNVLGCVFLYRGNILVLARVFSQLVFLGGRVMGLVEPGEYLLVFVFSARPGCSSSYHMFWSNLSNNSNFTHSRVVLLDYIVK